MEEKDIIKGRIKDLALKAGSESYLTHTGFLSMSEQAIFYDEIADLGGNRMSESIYGVRFHFRGGHIESDRKVAFFLPEYMEENELDEILESDDIISCIHIYPKNIRFSEEMTHRDYLGALMHLGLERNQYGDILTEERDAYVFVLSSVADLVVNELGKVRHTVVDCEKIRCSECPYQMKFIEKNINVASERVDGIIAEAFHLSRAEAQRLIAEENVYISGRTIKNNSYEIKKNERVSVKGQGKFIYLSGDRVTRKNRLVVRIKVYS